MTASQSLVRTRDKPCPVTRIRFYQTRAEPCSFFGEFSFEALLAQLFLFIYNVLLYVSLYTYSVQTIKNSMTYHIAIH